MRGKSSQVIWYHCSMNWSGMMLKVIPKTINFHCCMSFNCAYDACFYVSLVFIICNILVKSVFMFCQSDIEEVILMGGGTRIPKVQEAIMKAIGRYFRNCQLENSAIFSFSMFIELGVTSVLHRLYWSLFHFVWSSVKITVYDMTFWMIVGHGCEIHLILHVRKFLNYNNNASAGHENTARIKSAGCSRLVAVPCRRHQQTTSDWTNTRTVVKPVLFHCTRLNKLCSQFCWRPCHLGVLHTWILLSGSLSSFISGYL